MSKIYKVQYQVNDDSNDNETYHTHERYYRALDSKTALDMFEETCHESLVGYNIKPLAVFKRIDNEDQHHWKQVLDV